jgi:hypothetical protein
MVFTKKSSAITHLPLALHNPSHGRVPHFSPVLGEVGSIRTAPLLAKCARNGAPSGYSSAQTSIFFGEMWATHQGRGTHVPNWESKKESKGWATRQYHNDFVNRFDHVVIGLNGGPLFGQNPKSDSRFLFHFVFGSPLSPGVPGVITRQKGGKLRGIARIRVTGLQAQIIRDDIKQGIQNAPPYDVYGQHPSCDCAGWVQNVLGDAGINSGPPTQYPSTLLQQLDSLYPQ